MAIREEVGFVWEETVHLKRILIGVCIQSGLEGTGSNVLGNMALYLSLQIAVDHESMVHWGAAMLLSGIMSPVAWATRSAREHGPSPVGFPRPAL